MIIKLCIQNTGEKYLKIAGNGYICEDCETGAEEKWNNDSRDNEEEETNNLWEEQNDSVIIEIDQYGIYINENNKKTNISTYVISVKNL